jgi:hypothetical protein
MSQIKLKYPEIHKKTRKMADGTQIKSGKKRTEFYNDLQIHAREATVRRSRLGYRSRTMQRTHGNGTAWVRGLCGLILAGWLGMAMGADAGRIVLAVGDTRMDGQSVKEGAAVPEGAELSTGADGYLYLKTLDNGFLILRPGSVATVVAYRIDDGDPQKSRFKFSLRQGVARSISGEAVGKAKENFRFNTPVAAIGVRGTDFSVYADAEETRVVVFSGGVVVSGYDATSQPGGAGPCAGMGSKEFFAGTLGVLQIQKEENVPRIVGDKSLSPDFVTPPRPDEPEVPGNGDNGKAKKSTAASSAVQESVREVAVADALPQDSTAQDSATQDSTSKGSAAPPAQQSSAEGGVAGSTPLKQIADDQETANLDPLKQSQLQPVIWGRWQAISDDLPATVDIDEMEETKERYVIISNDHYLVWRNKENAVLIPASGGLSFTLADSQAHVEGAFGQATANVSDGSLSFDFDRALFSTWIDLDTQGQNYHLSANGSVSANGIFESNAAMTGNMEARGFLSEARGEMSANYVFQSTLEDGVKASGVTFWNQPRPVAP